MLGFIWVRIMLINISGISVHKPDFKSCFICETVWSFWIIVLKPRSWKVFIMFAASTSVPLRSAMPPKKKSYKQNYIRHYSYAANKKQILPISSFYLSVWQNSCCWWWDISQCWESPYGMHLNNLLFCL